MSRKERRGLAMLLLLVPLTLFALAGCFAGPSEEETARKPSPTVPPSPEPTTLVDAEPTTVVEPGPQAGQRKTVPYFLVGDCDCGGVGLPLLEDHSRTSQKPFEYHTTAGNIFQDVQQLHCEWAREYSSDQKPSAWIGLDLDIFRLNSADEARAFFGDVRAEILKGRPDCKTYGDCQFAVDEDEPERVFLVTHTVFVRGDGVVLPSSHYASLAQPVSTEWGDFVIEIYLSHPELEMGDPWTAATALTLADCAVAVANGE